MRIAFIGHGYVGLVTATVFADLGNQVWVVGRTKEKIEKLKQGIPPFYEPGLEEMVKRNLKAGRLNFTLDYHIAVPDADIVFIAVGTPSASGGEADLRSVFAAARDIAKNLNGYTVIATKSTVPPGTNRQVFQTIKEEISQKAKFDIASVPEFLREGTAISDTQNPDRVVIGVESAEAKKILLDLHKPIDGKTVICNIETAEMIKYASNSLLATKISFANAMAFICEKVGADVEQVLEGVGLDKRLGRSFLYPGVGYGGSCFPKDVKALIALAKNTGYDFNLLKAVDEINKYAAEYFVQKIVKNLNGIKGKNIAVLGLSFKPNTDDMRDAPSITIIKALKKLGAGIKAYDPAAMKNASGIIPDITFSKNAYAAATGSDAIVIVTEWSEFRQLDLAKILKLLKRPYIFDGRNIYEPEKMKKLGFKYFSVGRL